MSQRLRSKKKALLKRSLLGYAIALAASGMAQQALAVDLCEGATTTVSALSPDDLCTLNTGATLTVAYGGSLGLGVIVNGTNVTVTNNGLLGELDYGGAAPATALYYSYGGLTAALSNTGAIGADDYENAYGVRVDGDVSAVITNASLAVIRADAGFGDTDDADAYALYISGNLAASLSNAGTLAAEADAGSYTDVVYGGAVGLYVEGVISAALTNTGTITAGADADGFDTYSSTYAYANANADAYGIVADDISAQLSNDGYITAYAGAYADAYADGYTSTYTSYGPSSTPYPNYSYYGNASAHAYATAEALHIGALSGQLSNTGSIVVFAYAAADAYEDAGYDYSVANAHAVAISIGYGGLSGSLVNQGNIEAEAEVGSDSSAEYSNAYATGIQLQSVLTGSLTNGNAYGGGINANADAYASYQAYAKAVGIDNLSYYGYGGIGYGGTLTNAGYVAADAEAEVDYYGGGIATASATGISLAGAIAGSLSNSGWIDADAEADAEAAYATATGVYGYGGISYGGSFITSGDIESEADAYGDSEAEADAYGVYLNGSLDGTLDNSSDISADANAYVYGDYGGNAYGGATAIYINGGIAGSLTNSGWIAADAIAGANYYDAQADYAMAEARGIYSYGGLSGTLGNTGGIGTYAQAMARSWETSDVSAYATASSITLAGSVSGTLQNDEDIYAYAGADAESDYDYGGSAYANADARGVSVSGIDAGGVLNNGGNVDVYAYAMADASAYYSSSVNANADAYAVAVAAGYVSGELINSGTITAAALVEGDAYGYYSSVNVYANARALSVDALDGVLTNSGTVAAGISVDSRGSGDGTVIALSVSGDLNGSATNTGTLSAEAFGEENGYGTLDAYAVWIGDDLNGDIVNSGTITVDVFAPSQNADAYAVYVEGSVSAYGGLLNDETGVITLNVASDDSADVTAVYVDCVVEGLAQIDNRGLITVSARALEDASIAGIMVNHDLRDSAILTNTGTITLQAEGMQASVAGIGVDDLSGYGGIYNGGTLSLVADGGEDADAVAVYFDGASNSAEVINENLVRVSAMSGVGNANAVGVSGYQLYGSAVVNNVGNLEVEADGQLWAGATGIQVYAVNDDAQLRNEGMITLSAVNHEAGGARAEGISAYYVYGGIVNEGDLDVSATSEGGSLFEDNYAEAYGINAGYVYDASVINDGNITVTASAGADDGSADAYGIYAYSLGYGGTIINNGNIVATANADEARAYSLYVDDGSSGLVQNNGLLDGGFVLYDTSLANAGTIVLRDSDYDYYDGYVGNDYVQEAGGTLELELIGSGSYGRLYAEGVADFTAGNSVVLRIEADNQLEDGDEFYDVIYASSGLLTGDDGLSVVDYNVFWEFAATVDSNSLDLVASYVPAAQALGDYNMSSSFAAFIDGVLADGLEGEYPELAEALNNATTAEEAAQVLQQIAPTLSGGAGQATVVATAGVSDAVGWRLGDVGASSGDGFSNGNWWIKPFISLAEQDDVDSVNGYDVDSSGFVLGVDGEASDNLRLGVAVGSANSEADGSGSNLDISSVQFVAYGKYAFSDRTSLDVQAAYGNNSYESSRRVTIVNDVAVADFDGTQFSLDADLSHTIKVSESTTFVPSAGVKFVQVDLDGYSETGAGVFNLDVADAEEDVLLLTLEGGLEHRLSKNSGLLASLGVAFDTSADAASVGAALSGNPPSYTVNGIEPEELTITGGVGYRYVTGKDLEISANYDLESRSDFTASTFSLKFKMPF